MNLLANLRHLRLSHVLFTVLVAAILLYLIIPVLIVVPMSFSEARFLQFPPKQWSFHWYEAFFNSVLVGPLLTDAAWSAVADGNSVPL